MSKVKKHRAVNAYIKLCAHHVAPLSEGLRDFVRAAMPGATGGMQYGAPIFKNANGVRVIHLFASKRHVNFGFLRRGALEDLLDVLKGSGKPSKHIKLSPDQPYDRALFVGFPEPLRSNQLRGVAA